eukprot:1954122-Pyramimonas_sp.AAC.1
MRALAAPLVQCPLCSRHRGKCGHVLPVPLVCIGALLGHPLRKVFIISKGVLLRQRHVLEGVLGGTLCVLAIRIDHQHCLQRATLGYGASATTRADWALSPTRA